MKPAPDHVTQDLRRYQAEQDKLEREAPTKRELLIEAHEEMQEDALLAAFLEDEFLAAPLARIFRNFENATKEMSELFGRHKLPHLEAILQACSRMERDIASRMVEEKEL